MKLDEFLAANSAIPISNESVQSVDFTNAVAFDCAILGSSSGSLRIEYLGTMYFVDKADIDDVQDSATGVVTASGHGTPVRLMLKSAASLSTINRISAASLVNQRPFVLARPTQATDITFPQLVDEREEQWLKARGLLRTSIAGARTMSSSYCDSTSPSTSQRGLDNWVSDDSQSDDQHPDD